MTRDQLEAKLWVGLTQLGLDRSRRVIAANIIDNWLDAADMYADRREHRAAMGRLQAMQRDTPEHQAARRAELELATKGK